MNVTRRRQAAELAAALHPLMLQATELQRAEADRLKYPATSIVIEAEPYNAARELDIVVNALEQSIDVLVSLPMIGAPL